MSKSDDYQVVEPSPSNKALSVALQATCEELRCYGETYSADLPSSKKLKLHEKYISACTIFSEEVRQFFVDSNIELYGDGVGLPGNCKAHGTITIQVLETLVKNTHHFDAGGTRLQEAAKIFHSAITVPLYIRVSSRDKRKSFLGVLVLYFVREPVCPDVLIEYLKAMAVSVSVQHNLLHKSDMYRAAVERRGDEDQPAPSRKLSKTNLFESLEIEASTGSEGVGEHLQVGSVQSGKLSQKSDSLPKDGIFNWLSQYVQKWRGGAHNFLEPLKNEYCAVAFIGSFTVFAVLQIVFDKINSDFVFRDKSNLFPLPPSFGALSTLVFTLPAAPLSQPRLILQAHTLAITVCVVLIQIFPQNYCVWLQKALAAALTIAGMAKLGVLHPPAGALCIAIIQYYNSASYSEAGLLFTILSVYICCAVVVFLAMFLHNALRDRSYPICW